MPRLRLLARLIGRPLISEPLRSLLTVACVSTGVAVIVAIDMAGDAAAGSFRSSMESLQGDASLEISQIGGLPDATVGRLARVEAPLQFSARVEGFATLVASGERVPLFGVDLIGDETLGSAVSLPEFDFVSAGEARLAWVSAGLGLQAGKPFRIAVNDRIEALEVQGLLRDGSEGGGLQSRMLVVDIGLAQELLDRSGRVDRVYVHAAPDDVERWLPAIEASLPEAAHVEAAGARSREYRKLLNSFRWNLKVISYVALIVGAFLIYNSISVRVVRRRPLIGVARALGMTPGMVRAGFLCEGLMFGIAGTALGFALGRVLAVGAVELMGRTVDSLYASAVAPQIAIRPGTVAVAACAGLGVALLSAWWPAHQAASVRPAEAMAKGRHEYAAGMAAGKWAVCGVACAVVAILLCFIPAWDRLPLGGFAGAVGLIAASTMLTPFVARAGLRAVAAPALATLGPGPMIGAKILEESLSRTVVIVAAMATATAMMVSVGIMVGSLRETVLVWMDDRLRADLYVQPELASGEGDASTMSEQAVATIGALDSVRLVDPVRRYAIRYGGLPATLVLVDFGIQRGRSTIKILDGPGIGTVSRRLAAGGAVIASEPFGSKHGVGAGDTLTLPLGDRSREFDVVAIYHDYSSERGQLIGHRDAFLEYFPDGRLSGAAVYLKDGVDLERGRAAVNRAVAGYRLLVLRNRELRQLATASFDRTFAITDAIGFVALLVAVLGMAGALLTLVVDRRAELAVLRVVGATKRQVRQLVLAQAGLLGLLANAAGAMLGAALAVVLVKVVNKQSFGWTIQFHWPVGLLLGAMTAIFAASLVAGLYPARVATARDPIGVLHEG